jgi:CBS domain-containing protein
MNYKAFIKEAWNTDQELVTIPSKTNVREALEILKRNRFTQVPVVDGEKVFGTFSHRSFAETILNLGATTGKDDPLDLEVVHFIEKLKKVSINEKIQDVLEEFNLKDAVLLTSGNSPEGIITCFDMMKYFEKIAESYLLLRQSELGLRELMRSAIGDKSESSIILETVGKNIRYRSNDVNIPEQLEDLSWQDYSCLATHSNSWPIFKPVFQSRILVKAKLKPIPEIRNKVFHFRNQPEKQEIDRLAALKDWIFNLQDRYIPKGGIL